MILLHLILRSLPQPISRIVVAETRLQIHRVALLRYQVTIFGLSEAWLALAEALIHAAHRFIEARLDVG